MEQEQIDVNPENQEGFSSEAEQVETAQSSAETENTGTEEFPTENPGWPEGVYERFKSVNEKKKELEAQLAQISERYKPYEENADKFQAYEQFDRVIQQNPQLWESIKAAWNQGLGLDQMTPDQLQLLQTAQALQTTNQSLSQMVVGNYQRDFEGWYKEVGYPQESKQAVLGVAQNIMSQVNPNWQISYEPQVVGRVLEEVKKQVDAFMKSNVSSYIQQKKQTVPPTASRGTSQPQTQNKFEPRENFVARMKQMGELPLF